MVVNENKDDSQHFADAEYRFISNLIAVFFFLQSVHPTKNMVI